MLTFRVGAAGSAAGGRAMAAYLLATSTPREAANVAAYYSQGEAPADDVGRVTAVFAGLVVSGAMDRSEAVEALLDRELSTPVAHAGRPHVERMAEVFGRLVAGGAMDYGEASDRLTVKLGRQSGDWDSAPDVGQAMLDRSLDAVMATELAVARRLDNAVLLATHERDYAGAVPEVRRDLHPGLARALGIEPGRVVSTDELANLLNGQRADGDDIAGKQRQRATENKSRVAFIDLTFSADKSLSVAWALAPTDVERAVLTQAHKDAVTATMAYIAGELGHMRMGKGGAGGREAGHVAWVGVEHYTARPVVENARVDAAGQNYTELLTLGRAGDPQLHTHTLLLATVLTDSGRVGSVDLDVIAGRVKEWGGLYQAHVATNLRRSGVDVALDHETGAARLTAVPADVREAFSKRSRDGIEAAKEHARKAGRDWDAMTPKERSDMVHRSVMDRRQPKQGDGGSDLAIWKGQADAMGYAHGSVLRLGLDTPAVSRSERLELARDVSLDGIDDLLQRRAKIDAQELRVLATRGLVASGVESAADIDALTRSYRERGVRQDGRDTTLIWGYGDPVRGKPRVGVTTSLHEGQEREVVSLVRAAAADKAGALSLAGIAHAVAAREARPVEHGGLRFGTEHGQAQRSVMDALGTGGRFSVAIGVAGSGKSALLAPLVDAWRTEGRRVYGAALAWRQTDELAGAGIVGKDRAALDAFIRRVDRGVIVPDRNSVVVLDELGLVGTRQMLSLLRLQDRHGFRLVAVGDPKQCQSIEAGPVIGLLRDALGEAAVPELLGTVRQQSSREREIAGLFRDGQAEAALAMKRDDGSVELVPGGYRDAVQRTAALWRERVEALRDTLGATVTVSAPTNADARAIGAAIREQRRAMGEVQADAVRVRATDQNGTAYDLALAVGDRVRLFARTHARFPEGTSGLIGNNGSVLTVMRIDDAGLILRTAAGREGEVGWDVLRDRQTSRIRLSYGDVLSIDSIQGVTSTEHINAMPAGTASVQGFKAYVAESRHRERSWLVVSDGAERREVSGRRMLNDVRPIGAADVWANMARNLSRQPEQSGALAFLAGAHHVRRAAVRMMQAGLHRVQTGGGLREIPSRSAAVAAHARVERLRDGIARAAEGLVDRIAPDRVRRGLRM